jgi:trk system potassium uptake protein TrkA
MAKHVVIVGGGAVGTHLASLLLAGGHQVTVIEVQREEIPRLQQELSPNVVRSALARTPPSWKRRASDRPTS